MSSTDRPTIQAAYDQIDRLEAEIERLRAALAANICPECEKIDEEDAYAAGGDNGFHS